MTFTDRGQGADVVIGGLPFKLAIKDDQPYERATAQFRKEQFDSAPTVGDQSLTGFWTRGQLSFHKGAGLTYYEVLEGETVLERYADSDGVEVSVPGKATLLPSLSDMSLFALDAVPAPLSAGGGVYVLTESGVEFTAGVGSTPIDTSDSEAPTSITSSGELYYVTNGNLIEKQAVGTEAKTNHVTNPSFETNTTGWAAGSGTALDQTNYATNPSVETNTTGWSVTSSTTSRTNLVKNPSFSDTVGGWAANNATPGIGSVESVNVGSLRTSGGATYASFGQFVDVTAGLDYTLQAKFRRKTDATVSGVSPRLTLQWVDNDDDTIRTDTASFDAFPTTGDTEWFLKSTTKTAPAGAVAVQARLVVFRSSVIPSGNTYYFDEVMLEQASDLHPYFDGDTTDTADLTYVWDGLEIDDATSTATGTTTVVASTAKAKFGTKSLKVSNPIQIAPAVVSYTVSGLTNGVTYKVLSWVYREAGTANVELRVDAGSALATTSTSGAWSLLETEFTASATSHAVKIAHAASGTPGTFYIDGLLWTEAPWDEGYFDGDSTDGSVIYAWDGTANASTSSATDSTTTILAKSADQAKYGVRSLLVYDEHGRSTPLTTSCAISGLTITQVYKVAVWVYVPAQARTVSISVDAGSALDTSTNYDQWELLTGTFTATATSHTLKVAHSGSGAAAAFYTDAVLWTESPYFGSYFDGSISGAEWAGTPHASKSTFVTSNGDTSTALWTNSDNEWVKAWWAKGRLWAVDDTGRWYTLSPAGGTVAESDAFWISGNAGANWSLTEGTGPVYITDGFDIYIVTVDSDGVVPTIATPTTAARVPLGEQISTISYYLGYIIIPTSRGVRVALTQDAQVLLGPLVMKGDFSGANRVGAFDARTYVVGRLEGRDGSTVLCQIDLAQFVTDLVPAYSPMATVTDLASQVSGVTVDSTGRLYTWAAETLLVASVDSKASTGYLTTGFHRFGTLEPKQFLSVLVRLKGAGGLVTVSRIDADDTETELDTITLPVTGTQVVDLDMDGPVEMVGLKFTLSRSATDVTVGPELLGYQLRALPAPRRQRMIRLPLLCLDQEQWATAKGYKGSAWDRLSALESMEETSAVVDYTDYRTDESAPVSVESVEHRGGTPPGTQGTGFGGVVFVTLRKI